MNDDFLEIVHQSETNTWYTRFGMENKEKPPAEKQVGTNRSKCGVDYK